MQVYSSLSGIPFYAPSAGYAPTNSADVSAIASAYQVVSSTATQPYAGTAYVTSINDAPVSAARAGNAANASLANSAYYDGTGRLISALPDSAAVSAIASSYVESGVSSKQDTLSFAYNTADQISSINGSALGGMDEAAVSGIASAYAESAVSSKLDSSASSSFYPADNPSGFISSVDLSDYATTAYVDSSISGFAYESAVSAWTAKQDQLTFGFNTANQISSIDGSALGGMDEAAVSGIASAYAESAVSSVSGNYYTTANESGFLTAQVQASWSESASASPSYIQDKPDLVDIVAGPGIVIDNPDGNTLRVSVAQAEEVVLWENTNNIPTRLLSFPQTLSENISNFKRVRISFLADGEYDSDVAPHEFEFDVTPTKDYHVYVYWNPSGTVNLFYRACFIRLNGTSMTVSRNFTYNFPNGDNNTTGYNFIMKIVGIHRTASN